MKIKKIKVDFKIENTNQEKLKQISQSKCQSLGLYECRIKESGLSGSDDHPHYYAIVTGYRYKAVKKKSSDLKQERCQILKRCEQTYLSAPEGQVRALDYHKIDQAIEESCF